VCRVPFSCFELPDSFSTIPRASGPFFMFCAPGLIFWRYRGRRVPFSCFACLDLFSAVPMALGPVFKFCTPELIFGGIEGVRSFFQVLLSRTRFRRYRGRRVPFSCFAFPGSFSAVPSASGPFFMFCVAGLVFGGVECVGSRFHVLLSWTRFQRCRVRRVPFSCFTRPYSFSTVPRASCPVFMFYAPGLVFDGSEGVRSLFHVLISHTRFRRYRERRAPFSCFRRSESFSAVPRASRPIFIFCPPGLVFGGAEGVGSRIHVLRF
jgi:hypothetical protein